MHLLCRSSALALAYAVYFRGRLLWSSARPTALCELLSVRFPALPHGVGSPGDREVACMYHEIGRKCLLIYA